MFPAQFTSGFVKMLIVLGLYALLEVRDGIGSLRVIEQQDLGFLELRKTTQLGMEYLYEQ